MRNLAPGITRQRLLIEGFYTIRAERKTVQAYFSGITRELGLKAYGKPTIFSPSGAGKKINQGFDAFIPLIDSGISLYIWGNARFFSAVIYSCKKFGAKKAVRFTKKFFKAGKIAYQPF